jgi:hypothetical protein
MINPRTIPYTPQRLAAIKQEITRTLPKVTHTPLQLAAISSDSLKETPQVTLETGRPTVSENVYMVSKKSHVRKFPSITVNKALCEKETEKRLTSYLPYIIGGVIVTLAIYFYLNSRIKKEKDETNSARL